MKTFLQFWFTVLLYLVAILFLGLSLAPGIFLVIRVIRATGATPLLAKSVALGFSIAAGYFLFGFTLIFLIGSTRALFRLKLREGEYPIFSKEAMQWAVLNSLYLLIHYTFMDYLLLTPFAPILLRMMGAKIGKEVQINSKSVFDAPLIEIGDRTVVGGSAVVIGHSVEHGILKLKKVVIGKQVTIGAHATLMPGCTIGDHAMIGASAVLVKDTKVGPNEVWYGVPAKNSVAAT